MALLPADTLSKNNTKYFKSTEKNKVLILFTALWKKSAKTMYSMTYIVDFQIILYWFSIEWIFQIAAEQNKLF